MKFGSYHTFQCPPWTNPAQVLSDELARVDLAEDLGFHSVWVPEQHFFDYCICPDAMQMMMHILGRTSRVRVGSAVVNLTLTHPLRFAERASVLDHLGGGRVDICVGRGYQWPQNIALQMDEDTSRERFVEALEIILAAWDGERHAYHGKFFDFPEVQIFPPPRRPAGEVFLHATGAATSLALTLERGLPAAVAAPFSPISTTAEQFSAYVAAVEASGHDPDLFLDRSVVVVYSLLAPSKQEARELARRPFEWHLSRLGRLNIFPGMTRPTWEELNEPDDVFPALDDADYERRCETELFFDDPESCAEKIAVLRDAGVRHLVAWMGVGGVAHEHQVRALRLFAEEVAPRFS